MLYFLYILQSQSNGKYYIGTTADLNERLQRHNSGRSKYTKHGIPWKLVYKKEYLNRSEAMNREIELKRLKNKSKIEDLVRTSRP